jgi:hypothetical protein
VDTIFWLAVLFLVVLNLLFWSVSTRKVDNPITAAKHVVLAAWVSCLMLPFHAFGLLPALAVMFPQWFFDPKDAMGLPIALLCLVIGVMCWEVVLMIFGASIAGRGLNVAKVYPGISGESTCRFAHKMHYLLFVLLVLTYFALFVRFTSK